MGQQKCLSRLMEVTKEKRCSWGYQTEKTDFQIGTFLKAAQEFSGFTILTFTKNKVLKESKITFSVNR